jgi:hypothetical protein
MENQKNEIVRLDWNFYSITNYIKHHFIQILLFILVFIIIYIVDHISQLNAMMYGITQIPGITNSSTTNLSKKSKMINAKTNSKKRNK